VGKKSESSARTAVIALLALAIGQAVGNIAPDFSDVLYFTSVQNGTITNPVVALMVYDVFPAIQYLAIAAIIALTWYVTNDPKLTLKVGLYVFSFVYIAATIFLIGLFATLIPEYSIPVDLIICTACGLSILSIEGKITWGTLFSLTRRQWAAVIMAVIVVIVGLLFIVH
jgi:hypothetical protein